MPNQPIDQSATSTQNGLAQTPPARSPYWGWGGEIAKWTAVILIFFFCIKILSSKLKGISWAGGADASVVFQVYAEEAPKIQAAQASAGSAGKLLAQTSVISSRSANLSEKLSIDVTGVKRLFLVVNDSGNGTNCDWANWIEPVLTGAGKSKLDLTEVRWESAKSQLGEIGIGKNVFGGKLQVAGKSYSLGLGTHANSVIEFVVPDGYESFEVLCGLDNGGTDQPGIWTQISNTPTSQLVLALLITAINFVILTGYDWIAIEYLKKKLPWQKIMIGAVIGYAFSNVFGWMLGGSSVRYRLYTRWGFSFIEVLAFISVLSVTFWLGMFLLAGIAFVSLPVHLPAQYADVLPFTPVWFGYLFLFVVLIYLAASLLIRRPLRIGNQEFRFPPFRLSLVQLSVSATDFALASWVLYLLLPDVGASYGTVLVSYIVAMVVTVIVHVPGGFGILELIVLDILTKDVPDDQRAELVVGVTSGIVLFRVIYYFIPGGVAGLLYMREEITKAKT